MAYIILREGKWLALLIHTSKDKMRVGIVSVVMTRCIPLKLRLEVFFHPLNHAANVVLKVDVRTSLRRDDESKVMRVTSPL
jgi:hypothetical protein